MNEENFHKRLKEILSVKHGANDSPLRQFHDTLSAEVQGRSKKDWDDETAAQVMQEFERVMGVQPAHSEPSEEEIKRELRDFISEREYVLSEIREGTERTPDCYIEKGKHRYLCEIKSPILNLDLEAGLYKFKTTHRKILSFIHTAIKQFKTLDPEQKLPRVLVFTSSHFQLNWKSFFDAIRGGVADRDGNLVPDFTKTPIYSSTLPLLVDVDLYIWFQVSEESKKFYQVSYFINSNSRHVAECARLINDLSVVSVSSMDNIIQIEHTNT